MIPSKPWKQDNRTVETTNQQDHQDPEESNNPLAIVPSSGPEPEPEPEPDHATAGRDRAHDEEAVTAPRARSDEVESKISAWEAEEMAKINNRYRRQEAIINGWEGEQIEQAGTWLKKIERKLEGKRAKAVEKMQNDVAIARQKAEEKRASMEAKRGEKIARVLELAKLMKIVGQSPSKRSFFRPYKHDSWA
ncbi:remorin 4.1-like [Asparagus officinalis]|uniref:remorin 4.1-like n=1 Tax=Asparagus officinalis TaxID=4686 RepID=UPI00098DE4AF|nr:remorin 4.1-like [Asparagus officinalis]